MDWDKILFSIPSPWDRPSRLSPKELNESQIFRGIDALEMYIRMNDERAFQPDWRLIFETLYLPTDEYDPNSEFDHGELLTWNQVLEKKANYYALMGETFDIEEFREPTVEIDGVVRTDLSKALIFELEDRVPIRKLTLERFNEYLTGNELPPGFRYPPERCLKANSPEFDEIVLAHKQKTAEKAELEIWSILGKVELSDLVADRLSALFRSECKKWFRDENFVHIPGRVDYRPEAIMDIFWGCQNREIRLRFVPALKELVEQLRLHPELKTPTTTDYEKYLNMDWERTSV